MCACEVTVSELAVECKIDEEWLNTRFEAEHARALAESVLQEDDWNDWAGLLDPSHENENLDVVHTGEKAKKFEELLEKWRKRQLKAKKTFLSLVETFLKGGNTEAAEKICEFLKGYMESKSGCQSETAKATALMTCDSHDGCSCTGIQIGFLNKLKNALTVYREAGWSEEKVFEETKLAIRSYMEKSIKAGSSDPLHLFEVHVHNLYKREMLFSDPELLDEPRKMAEEALSLLKPPPTPQSSVVISSELPPLFSKEFLFHASLCCRVVNECTHTDFTDFFTKPKALHEFSEMSMTTSDVSGRYLIAKQGNCEAEIFYIAFNGGLDKTMWPTECSGMDIFDAIQQNVDKFPAGFVEELLNKEKRVILTGFSIGGIFACSLLVKMHRDFSSCLSQELLRKNLACITFSQPHLPVPGLRGPYRALLKVADSIHVVLSAQDVFPRLLGILYKSRKWDGGLQELCDAFQMLHLKGNNEEIVAKLKEICCAVEPARAIPGLDQPMTYHLFVEKGKELVCEKLSGEELAEHSSYKLHQVNEAICSDSKLPMTEMLWHISRMVTDFVQAEGDYDVPSTKSMPKPVVELEPEITRIEVHKYSMKQDDKPKLCEADHVDLKAEPVECKPDDEELELALAVEGSNLWFFSKAKLKGKEIEIRSQEICGNSVQINFSTKDEALHKLSNGEKLEVGIVTSFKDDSWRSVEVYTKEYAMSKRQKQLAKLTPSQVIELSYLCALLEKQSSNSNDLISARMDAIRSFLEKVIDVVPLENLGFSMASANPTIRRKCMKALKTKLLSSQMMYRALLRATKNCECKSHLADQQEVNPLTGSPELKCCTQCSFLNHYRNSMQKTSNAICDLNVRELFDKLEIKSPIEALTAGRKRLNELSKSKRTNAEMLEIVNEIRENELAVCISLLGSFMDQQETRIPLVNDEVKDVSGSISIGVWALSSFSQVKEIMNQAHTKKLEVNIRDYRPCFGDKDHKQQETHDSHYSSKLHFIVQGLDSKKIVTYNSQYVSYSLERQLLEYEKGKDLKRFDVKKITEEWGVLFQDSALSLVAESHRSVIARWLKWSLMVHNLREELAKHTAVGVVGLVNSGKSSLIENCFGKNIPTGTTEDKRTTIPFLYNINDEVDVVDFPGVDDVDESIGQLADLLIKLAQIVVFVVDYRKANSESSEKWVTKLKQKEVPVLVCLTYADRLYSEIQKSYKKEHNQSPPEGHIKKEIEEQLLHVKQTLGLPGSWECGFFFFALSEDSTLNNEAGKQQLKKEGILDHSDVGSWLVKVFERRFFQPDVSKRLRDLFAVYTSATNL